MKGNSDQWRESLLILNINLAYYRPENLAKVRVTTMICIIVSQVGHKLIVLCNFKTTIELRSSLKPAIV
jgi:hypothetical protein